MAAEIQLTDDTFEKEVLQSPGPVLVDFWAPWCNPCRMVSPIVADLAKEYAGRLKVAKLNTDENPSAATKFNVMAIPTILLFKGGRVEHQIVGVHTKADIKQVLDPIVGRDS
jgi:thioredoxin 1